MQNLHRAANDTFLATHTRRVGQRYRFAAKCPAFDVDSHLAVLVANIAINALTFFGSDFELRPASPKVHPKRQWTPHAAPNALAKERVEPNRQCSG